MPLFIILVLNVIPNPTFSCPLHQKQALLHFKSTLTNSTIIDSKFGLNLKLTHGIPILIAVPGTMSIAALPPEPLLRPEIGKLQKPEALMLFSNYFLGNIPKEIWNLTKLRVLHVANNQVSGRIPSSIVNLKELQELYLAENSLSMQIPAEIGRLLNMTIVDLSGNQLTGPISTGIQNLSKLHVLELHDNMFVGYIPTWLFNIRTLKVLYICGEGDSLVWDNNAKIVPRVSLAQFSVTSCGISGQVPDKLGFF